MVCNCTLPCTNPAACDNCSSRQQFYSGFGVSEFNTTHPYNERLFDKPTARRRALLRRQRNKHRGK